MLGVAWERPLSLAGVALCAAVSLALGNLGVYLVLTRAWKPPEERTPLRNVAVIVALLCCVPALLGGATYLHALLLFLTWV